MHGASITSKVGNSMAQASISSEHAESHAGVYSTPLTLSTLALTTFFLAFVALTIGAFAGTGSVFTTIGGWLGIITAIIASYTALASMGTPFALPTGEH